MNRSTAPYPLGLNFAARGLPGGLETMMHLAALSSDDRARAVARRWYALPRKGKDRAFAADELCSAAGIDAWEFHGAVASTAFELGMDVSEILRGFMDMPAVTGEVLARARAGRMRALRQVVEATEFFALQTR